MIWLFAFSSIIGNYYYGETNVRYIKDSKLGVFIYRLAVAAMVMVGAVVSLDFAWSFADITMALLTLCNLVAIVLLSRQAVFLLQDYRKQKKEGVKDDAFGCLVGVVVKFMLEYTKHQFVRDKLSLRNIAVGSAAQFGAACDMVAKDLARRNVMQMVAVYEFFALGPLTAAGCPENYKIQHCRLSMVFATRNAWLTGTVAWSE